MNRRLVIVALSLAAGLLVATAQNQPQDVPQRPNPEEARAMMEKWRKLAQPGEHHRFLGQLVGDWDLKNRRSACSGAGRRLRRRRPPAA